MLIASPYERIQQLIGLIELNPSKKQVVKFLSLHVCPEGEISGISWMTLQGDGHFSYDYVYGLTTRLDPDIKVSIVDDNVVALALRTTKTQMFDMQEMFSFFKGATHKKGLSVYSSGITLPIDDKQVLGIVLSGSFKKLAEYKDYFECIRLVLSLWQSRIYLETSVKEKVVQSKELTDRQKNILEMIKEGRTNGSIASILGYSESLIKQETIIIYKKLGVAGRVELKEAIQVDAEPNI